MFRSRPHTPPSGSVEETKESVLKRTSLVGRFFSDSPRKEVRGLSPWKQLLWTRNAETSSAIASHLQENPEFLVLLYKHFSTMNRPDPTWNTQQMAYKNGERAVLLELARLAEITELDISQELKAVANADRGFIDRLEQSSLGSQSGVRRQRNRTDPTVVPLHNSGQP